jgi:hypothetical protein
MTKSKQNLDPAYRDDITKQSDSREYDKAESRSPRPSDRDEEIVEIAGEKFIRTPTKSLRNDNPVLPLEKKAGFYRRWINASTPGRLQQVVNLGFKQCTTIEGKLIKAIERTTKTGIKEKLIPMEIPEEIRNEFERAEALLVRNKDQEANNAFKDQSLGYNSQTYIVSDKQQTINR